MPTAVTKRRFSKGHRYLLLLLSQRRRDELETRLKITTMVIIEWPLANLRNHFGEGKPATLLLLLLVFFLGGSVLVSGVLWYRDLA